MLRKADAARVRTLHDLPASGLRFINRQPGSGTRLLMDHLLHTAGIDPARITGWHADPEESHVTVAATVASGSADCGPGLQAAAEQFGLAFQPLTAEDYFLVCLKDALKQPAVLCLCAALRAPDWERNLGVLPGYEPSVQAGEVLSPTRALPWWHYRATKAAASKALGTVDDNAAV